MPTWIIRRPFRLLTGVLLCAVMVSPSLADGRLDSVRRAVRDEDRDDTSSDDGGRLSDVRSVVNGSESRRRKRRRRRRRTRSICFPPVFFYDIFEVDDGPVPREPAVPTPLVRPVASDSTAVDIPIVELSRCRFPYGDACPGYAIDSSPTHEGDNFVARVRMEHGFRYDGVQRSGIAAHLEDRGGVGLQGDWHRYTERLDTGRTDRLDFGDVNVVFRAVETEQFHARVGLGVNWMNDRFGTEAGVNFTAGVECFPVRPWVVTAELDIGGIGEATMIHGRVTVGAIWDRIEFFAGYDVRTIESVTLQGPLAGLRVWF